MSRTIHTTIYEFDELNDQAKEKARNWYRQFVFSDSNDWDSVYENAAEVADLFGLDIRTRRVTQMDKSRRYEPNIYFSGFWSQGDGACFEGEYCYKKGGLKAVKAHAPKDDVLHRIVFGLQEAQRKAFYKLIASTKQRGHYNHSGCMSVDVNTTDGPCWSEPLGANDVQQLLREFADWIYRQLEKEYEWQSADEQVDESIRANEYEFTEGGERA